MTQANAPRNEESTHMTRTHRVTVRQIVVLIVGSAVMLGLALWGMWPASGRPQTGCTHTVRQVTADLCSLPGKLTWTDSVPGLPKGKTKVTAHLFDASTTPQTLLARWQFTMTKGKAGRVNVPNRIDTCTPWQIDIKTPKGERIAGPRGVTGGQCAPTSTSTTTTPSSTTTTGTSSTTTSPPTSTTTSTTTTSSTSTSTPPPSSSSTLPSSSSTTHSTQSSPPVTGSTSPGSSSTSPVPVGTLAFTGGSNWAGLAFVALLAVVAGALLIYFTRPRKGGQRRGEYR